MLVLSRTAGESIVIADRFQVTVAVIGTDFVDLRIKERGDHRDRVVTLHENELRQIVAGVHGVLIRRIDDKVRLGFECDDVASIRRGEFESD